jgi:hypothetical protein
MVARSRPARREMPPYDPPEELVTLVDERVERLRKSLPATG